ncbi:MAG TPA: hypothetical protein VJL83_03475 [Patescibacteria group bacterium]|nr:hypothetical protein [Patescibacteria group bacterium]
MAIPEKLLGNYAETAREFKPLVDDTIQGLRPASETKAMLDKEIAEVLSGMNSDERVQALAVFRDRIPPHLKGIS